jgi:hypothetical protein
VVVFWVASAQVDGVSNACGRGASMLRVRGRGGRTCRARYVALGMVLSSRLNSASPDPGPSKLVGVRAAPTGVFMTRFVGLPDKLCFVTEVLVSAGQSRRNVSLERLSRPRESALEIRLGSCLPI